MMMKRLLLPPPVSGHANQVFPFWMLKLSIMCVYAPLIICFFYVNTHGYVLQIVQHQFGQPAGFSFHPTGPFPSTELWSAAIIIIIIYIFFFTFWFMNSCEDGRNAMIHGLSCAHLGVSFSAPYHHKGSCIITAGHGKCFVTMWLRRVQTVDAAKWKPLRSAAVLTYNLLALHGSVAFVCLLPYIIGNGSLWDCGVLVSVAFCSAALIL